MENVDEIYESKMENEMDRIKKISSLSENVEICEVLLNDIRKEYEAFMKESSDTITKIHIKKVKMMKKIKDWEDNKKSFQQELTKITKQ